jgi:hypothetical protein
MGKPMGKPWENPWENHGKTMGKLGESGRNHGVSAEKPLVFMVFQLKTQGVFRPVPMNTTDLPSAKSAMGMALLNLILWLSERIRKKSKHISIPLN